MKKTIALSLIFISAVFAHPSGAEDKSVVTDAEKAAIRARETVAEKAPQKDGEKPTQKKTQDAPKISGEKAAFTLTVGKRTDNLDWNIAGNLSGTNPNVLSELKWKDLSIFQIKAAGRGTIKEVFFLRGAFGIGFIYDGKNQDSDYSCDDRRCEFSRSDNKADTGSVRDFTFGGGFKNTVALKNGVFTVIPLIGFSQHNQNLKITDGYQTIPATGAFGGLNSSYKARWRGPWAGLDIGYSSEGRGLALTGTFEYHVVSYHAEADWNLRADFAHPKSFEHNANGTGYVAAIGADYRLKRNWGVYAGLDYLKFKTSRGTDRTYFSDGAMSDTRLNEVNWRSHSVNAGFRRRF
ncbi:MAG: TonB-dependent receptor [Deltaproteobacteria bacterium]|nr:TonB-dependent receptor [Deltaproteobacteria bacterium]